MAFKNTDNRGGVRDCVAHAAPDGVACSAPCGHSGPSILHILPQDGIGGAELAANSAAHTHSNVRLLFLLPPASPVAAVQPRIHQANARSPFGAKAMRATYANLRQDKPEVVIFSLWKTVMAYLVVLFFYPATRRVTLIHSDRAVHFVDNLVTWFMMKTSHAVWADSQRSLLRAVNGQPQRVVSFVISRLPGKERKNPGPEFVYWGRLTELKDIPLALQLVAEVKKRYGSASFVLIGPDVGILDRILSVAQELNLSADVTYAGVRSREEIVELAERSSFFLQLSRQEGMAMSVVEAMQLGLVPVVTPVGEISNYCAHGSNALVFEDLRGAAEQIIALLSDPARFAELSRGAAESWQNVPIYADDFVGAASELIHSEG